MKREHWKQQQKLQWLAIEKNHAEIQYLEVEKWNKDKLLLQNMNKNALEGYMFSVFMIARIFLLSIVPEKFMKT